MEPTTTSSFNALNFEEHKIQLFAVLSANIIILSHGIAVGWSSPVMVLLQSSESPLHSGPITISEVSWLGSVMFLGAFIGSLFFGIIADYYGRKMALYLITIPHMLFWILALVADNVSTWYLARFSLGFSGGGSFPIVTLYMSEILHKEIRGRFCSILRIAYFSGFLIGFILDGYLKYEIVPKIIIILPILSFISLLFFPETSQFLLQKRNISLLETEVKHSLAFYNNLKQHNEQRNYRLKVILDDLRTIAEENSKEENQLKWNDMFTPASLKAIAFVTGLAITDVLSGFHALDNYTAVIFEMIGSDLGTTSSTIVFGTSQLAGAYLNTFFVDKLNRVFLLVSSLCLMALGYVATGIYVLFKDDFYQYSWIPTVTLSFVIFAAAGGIANIILLVMAEIMPPKLRPLGISLGNGILNLSAFAAVKAFPIVIEDFGLTFVMWILAAFCIICGIFINFILPETKGVHI